MNDNLRRKIKLKKPKNQKSILLQVVSAAISILALAVLIVDKLEEEHVEDDDEKGDGDPEQRGKASKVVAVFV